jgi:hypothetical protein
MTQSGMDRRRLELLPKVIEADVAAGLYNGAVLRVARGGHIVADLCVGSAP